MTDVERAIHVERARHSRKPFDDWTELKPKSNCFAGREFVRGRGRRQIDCRRSCRNRQAAGKRQVLRASHCDLAEHFPGRIALLTEAVRAQLKRNAQLHRPEAGTPEIDASEERVEETGFGCRTSIGRSKPGRLDAGGVVWHCRSSSTLDGLPSEVP